MSIVNNGVVFTVPQHLQLGGGGAQGNQSINKSIIQNSLYSAMCRKRIRDA